MSEEVSGRKVRITHEDGDVVGAFGFYPEVDVKVLSHSCQPNGDRSLTVIRTSATVDGVVEILNKAGVEYHHIAEVEE